MIRSQFRRLWRSIFPRRMVYDPKVDFYRFMRYGPWINRIRVSRWFWLLLLVLAYDLYWGDRWWLFYRWIPLVPYINNLLQEGAPWLLWLADHLFWLIGQPVQWSRELNQLVAEWMGVWQDGWTHVPTQEYLHPFVRKGVEHRFKEPLYRLHPRSVTVWAHGVRSSWQWGPPLFLGLLLLSRQRLLRRGMIWPDFEPLELLDYYSKPRLVTTPLLRRAYPHHPLFLEYQYYPLFLYYVQSYFNWKWEEQANDIHYSHLYPGEEPVWFRSDWDDFDGYLMEWYPFQLFGGWLLWLLFRLPLALLVLILVPLLIPPIFLYVSLVRPVLRATVFRVWWAFCWLLSFPLNPILRRLHPAITRYFRHLWWIQKDLRRYYFNYVIDAYSRWEARERFMLSTVAWTIEKEFVVQANWYQRQRIYMRVQYILFAMSNAVRRLFATIWRVNLLLVIRPVRQLYRLSQLVERGYQRSVVEPCRVIFIQVPRLLCYYYDRFYWGIFYHQELARYRAVEAQMRREEWTELQLELLARERGREDALRLEKRKQAEWEVYFQRLLEIERRRGGVIDLSYRLYHWIWTDRIACFDFLYGPVVDRLEPSARQLWLILKRLWRYLREVLSYQLDRLKTLLLTSFRLSRHLLGLLYSAFLHALDLLRLSTRWLRDRFSDLQTALWLVWRRRSTLLHLAVQPLFHFGRGAVYWMERRGWGAVVWVGRFLPRRLSHPLLYRLVQLRLSGWPGWWKLHQGVVDWLWFIPLRLTGWGVHRLRRFYGMRTQFRLVLFLSTLLFLLSPWGARFLHTFHYDRDLTHMVWIAPIVFFALRFSIRLRDWAWWDLRDLNMMFNLGLVAYIYVSHLMRPYTWERLFYLKLMVLGLEWIWITILVPLIQLYAYLALPLVEGGDWLMDRIVGLIVVAALPCYTVLNLAAQLLLDLLPIPIYLVWDWCYGWAVFFLLPLGYILFFLSYLLFSLIAWIYSILGYDTWTYLRLNWKWLLAQLILIPPYILLMLLFQQLVVFSQTDFYLELIDPIFRFFWWFVDKTADPSEPKMWWYTD